MSSAHRGFGGLSQGPHPNEVGDRWWDLREHLPDEEAPQRFPNLIARLSADADLVEWLQEYEFEADDAGLYLAVLATDPGPEFVEYCRIGLESIERNRWTSALQEEEELLLLLMALQKRGAKISLKQEFQDAVVDYAKGLLAGDGEPSQDFLNKRNLVLSPLRGSRRRNFRSDLRDAASAANEQYADGFFRMFGDELAKSRLEEREEVVTGLLRGVLRARALGGLEWLLAVLSERPDLLQEYSNVDVVTDLKERIETEISKARVEGDVTGELIRSIADQLGIRPMQSKRRRRKRARG